MTLEDLIARDIAKLLRRLRVKGEIEVYVGIRECSHSAARKRRIRVMAEGDADEFVGRYVAKPETTWDELGEMVREDVADAMLKLNEPECVPGGGVDPQPPGRHAESASNSGIKSTSTDLTPPELVVTTHVSHGPEWAARQETPAASSNEQRPTSVPVATGKDPVSDACGLGRERSEYRRPASTGQPNQSKGAVGEDGCEAPACGHSRQTFPEENGIDGEIGTCS